MKKSFYAAEFLKVFPKQRKRNIYLIVGEEQYFIDIVLNSIKKRFDVDEDDFDYAVFYAQETEVSKLLFELRQIPLTAERHFVILKDFDKYKAKDKEKIAEYSLHPYPKSVLVIVASDFDKRLKASKKLLENAIEIICKKPYSKEDILRWLKNKENELNIKFEYGARLYFAENVALDYLVAQNELEKILLYIEDKRIPISEDAVKESIGLSKKENIFALLSAIGNKDLKSALKILENVLDNGESPIMIISMLTNYFKTLWIINIAFEKGYSLEKIKKSYLSSVYYKFQNNYVYAAKKYSKERIRLVFKNLLEVDTKLKSIDIDEKLLLDLLLIKITGK